MNDFLELAHDRYSVRKISSRPVEQEKIDKIIEAGRIAPTAVNNQPFKLFVLKSPEALAKLDGAHHFPFVKSAPVVIIVGSKKDEAWVRPFDGLNYADIDASIAATQIMLAIHDQGLGSTWCGYFEPDKIKAEFPEMQDYNLIALFPIGYIDEGAAPSKSHTEFRSDEEMVSVY